MDGVFNEMKIKKVKDTFNTYSVELSWGQLAAITASLGNDHADPLADEAFREMTWYMKEVPGPGEDEDQFKDAKQDEKDAEKDASEARDTSSMGEEVDAPNEAVAELLGDEGAAGADGAGDEFREGMPELADPDISGEVDDFLEAPVT